MYQDNNTNTTGFRRRMQWLCAVLLVCATGAVTAAQTDALVPNPDPAMADEVIDANNAQVDLSNGCFIKFIAFRKDGTIREGLRLLAVLCKKNIVPSAGVDGPLTISRLYNVTFEQALEAVVGNNFKYEQDGDFVRVYTAEELKKIKDDPGRMVHKVITLYYITAAEAAKLVQPVLSISTQAKITQTSPAKKELSSGTGTSGGGGSSTSGAAGMSGSGSSGGSGDDMALNDMIVIYDYPENVEKAEAIIHDIDVRPKQVLVEATIMDVTLKEEMDLGVDWNLLSGVAVTGFPANIMRGTSAAQAQGTFAETAGFANPGSTGLSVGFSANNMQALITALETVTDTTILANPKILAVNKQLGRVQIGKTIGYRGSTTVSTGGVATQGEVQFMDTGTVLVFRPFIGNDGYIRMDIYPQESTAVLNADKVPDKTTAELTANILAKDGETIVIGGLFRDETSTTRNQVPVLGNLPFIGALFRSTADTTNRHEVIVLLTPHIIQEPSQTNGQARADDIRLKRDGARHALQGIDRTRLAEDSYAKAARYYLEGDTEKALFNVKFALMMRPTYLEALRLRERIMAETDPEQFKRMDSVVVENLDEQEAPNWRRY